MTMDGVINGKERARGGTLRNSDVDHLVERVNIKRKSRKKQERLREPEGEERQHTSVEPLSPDDTTEKEKTKKPKDLVLKIEGGRKLGGKNTTKGGFSL